MALRLVVSVSSAKGRCRLQPGDQASSWAREDRFVVGAMVAAFVLLGGGRRRSRGGVEFAQPGAELVALEQRAQRAGVARLQDEIVEVERQCDVHLDGKQHARLRQPVAGGAQVFADHTLDGVGVRQQVVEGAVFGEPLHRGFRPHLGDAGDVVDRIADQGEVIDDAFRRHAELGGHACPVERFLAHGVDQRDMVVDQLRHVLVAGGDDAADPALLGVQHQGADHVVGLDAVDDDERPALGADRRVQRLDLATQIVWHRRAMLLVGRIEFVAESLALGVEHAGDIIGRVVLAQPVQHGEHALDRIGRFARRVAQVGQRVERAIEMDGRPPTGFSRTGLN
jgi:hypothetical protein